MKLDGLVVSRACQSWHLTRLPPVKHARVIKMLFGEELAYAWRRTSFERTWVVLLGISFGWYTKNKGSLRKSQIHPTLFR